MKILAKEDELKEIYDERNNLFIRTKSSCEKRQRNNSKNKNIRLMTTSKRNLN